MKNDLVISAQNVSTHTGTVELSTPEPVSSPYPKGIDIGNCVLSLAIDDSQVSTLIERLLSAVTAFKAEWDKK